MSFFNLKTEKNKHTGKETPSVGWMTVCVCSPSYKFLINLRFEPVTYSVTFPARCASPLSSVPSWLTNAGWFIITGVGSGSVARRTWKLNISTWSCFTYIAAFISHQWSFYCSFSILFWIICSVAGHLFSCSKKVFVGTEWIHPAGILLCTFYFSIQSCTNTLSLNHMHLICI